MRILRLHVIGFGTLCDYRLELNEGLNILCEENGWGKSTLAVFIKAMLYGLPATTKRDLDQNERKKYTPWGGGTFGGSLEFCTQKGSFRVERTFGAKEAQDTFALYDLSTNLPSDSYSAALGEELFGINAEGFERSTYLSQREISEGSSNGSIVSRLSSLLDAVDDIDSYDAAIASLEKRKKHYVMTGNKGAVAELESTIFDRKRELEALQRKEETRVAGEVTLQSLNDELTALQDRANDLRLRLERAGLHRERAAFLEQKNSMMRELTDLMRQRDEISSRFEGTLPAEEELSEAKAIYGELAEMQRRLSMLSEANQNQEALLRLRKKYPKGLPSKEQLEALERENDAMLELRAKRDLLRRETDGQRNGQASKRKLPTAEEIGSAFALLERADRARDEARILEETAAQRKQRSPFPILPMLFWVLGAVLLSLGVAFSSSDVFLLFLLGGIAGLALGFVLFGASRKGYKKDQASDEKRALALRLEEARQGYAKVRDFLVAYGAPANGDLRRALNDLNALSVQHRTETEHQARMEEKLSDAEKALEQTAKRLHTRLSAFAELPSARQDYRDVLAMLRQDTSEIKRLTESENNRSVEMENRSARERQMRERLLPFLERYRSEKSLPISEKLDEILEKSADHRRLTEEIGKRQAELDRFVKEKQLDGEAAEGAFESYDALTEENARLQGQERSLLAKKAELVSQLGRLSMDTDRIPDVEAEISSLQARLEEYRENHETILHTQKLLEEAKTALSMRYLDGMQTSFRAFLCDLVGDGAPEALMDPSFEIRLREGGQTHSMDSFSRGWRDAVRFCVRLSLADALYTEGEAPLLLLDDPFVNLDDRRLTAARRLLDRLAKRYQIVYMICREEPS